jgi:hypothetical protein
MQHILRKNGRKPSVAGTARTCPNSDPPPAPPPPFPHSPAPQSPLRLPFSWGETGARHLSAPFLPQLANRATWAHLAPGAQCVRMRSYEQKAHSTCKPTGPRAPTATAGPAREMRGSGSPSTRRPPSTPTGTRSGGRSRAPQTAPANGTRQDDEAADQRATDSEPRYAHVGLQGRVRVPAARSDACAHVSRGGGPPSKQHARGWRGRCCTSLWGFATRPRKR